MPETETPFDIVAEPVRYPAPNYDGEVTACDVLVPETAEPVGTLVIQGEALDWLSTIDADHPGAGLRAWADALIKDNAKSGVPAMETWSEVLSSTVHGPTRVTALDRPAQPKPKAAPKRRRTRKTA